MDGWTFSLYLLKCVVLSFLRSIVAVKLSFFYVLTPGRKEERKEERKERKKREEKKRGTHRRKKEKKRKGYGRKNEAFASCLLLAHLAKRRRRHGA